jgi:thiol:disulfide interchange protein DsbC
MLSKKIIVGFLMMGSIFASAAENMVVPASNVKLSALTVTTPAPHVNAGKKISEEEIKLKIIKHIPRAVVTSVKQSAIPSLFHVDTNMGIIYMTHDGNYFIEGNLYGFTEQSIKNLTEAELDQKRKTVLAKQDPKKMIIFSPPKDKIKSTITVFTDIDCGYCRKLHSHMKEMNELGIEVRYIAYPRAGIGSDSYAKYVSAWCSVNQQDALTKVKSGATIPPKTCDNPVKEQYELGVSLGIAGTPAIILTDGTLLPGYMPPEQLAKEIGIAPSSAAKIPLAK